MTAPYPTRDSAPRPQLAIYSAHDVLAILRPVDGEPQPPRELALPVIRALVRHQLEWGYADDEIARGLRSLEAQLPGYPREFAAAREAHRSARVRSFPPPEVASERPPSWWRRSDAAKALVGARGGVGSKLEDDVCASPPSPPPVVVTLWGVTRCVIPRE
ncbi:hypothetical protein Q8F55_008179 [Vanrija albida]|uniref:Uncharacterized protein n=1 Tax=Vanrija albida TaxID=181172 RepID=A0ABR3PVL3_9TREE